MKVETQSGRISTASWAARSLLAIAVIGTICVTSPAAHAGVFVSVNFAPPALPVYVQPAIPSPGYIWTPGYWSYNADAGYFWVPGTWVMPPYNSALWTPGYWGWAGGAYAFHAGYWGLHVGYYGGINYGFGYGGVGYAGGYWGPHGFYYNREVNHITNVNITNVYSRTVVTNTVASRASFNGPNGVSAKPTPQEIAVEHESHTAAVSAQTEHLAMASQNESLRASVNHGSPAIAATSRPADFAAHTTALSHPTAASRIGNPNAGAANRGATTHVASANHPQHAIAASQVRHNADLRNNVAVVNHQTANNQHALVAHPAAAHAPARHVQERGQEHGQEGHKDHSK